MTGHLGYESTGLNALRGQNNVQGLNDSGANPPTCRATRPSTTRGAPKFSEAWGVEVPETPGYRLDQMMSGLHDGRVRALYLIGENPAQTEPNAHHVEEGLAGLEFLVSQDLFLNDATQRFAHVVLPASSFAEKDGTFTNTERRVNLVRAAVPPPGNARVDREIIIEVAAGWAEAGPTTPMRRRSGTSSRTSRPRGTDPLRAARGAGPPVAVPRARPSRDPVPPRRAARPGGRGKFFPVEYQPPIEEPDSEYPLVLSTGRTLYHYNSATMTMRESGITDKQEDASRSRRGRLEPGARQGDLARLVSRRGSLEARAHVTDRVYPGLVWIPTSPSEGQLAHARRRRLADRHARVQGLRSARRSGALSIAAGTLSFESVDRHLRGRFGKPYLYEPECESTQTLLAGSGLPEGAVAGDHQTAGRGRRGGQWEAPPGTSVLLSLLLHPPAGRHYPELTLVAALPLEAVEARPACRRSSSGRTT